MDNSLVSEIEARAKDLAELEEAGRSAHRMFNPGQPWLLGDAIRRTLGDVKKLVDAVRAGSAPDPLRAAIIGILRADGYGVTEPGGQSLPVESVSAPCSNPTVRKFSREYLTEELDLPGGEYEIESKVEDTSRWSIHYGLVFRTPDTPNGFAWETSYSVGATESQDERPWEHEDEVECTLVRRGKMTVDAWEPARLDEPTPVAASASAAQAPRLVTTCSKCMTALPMPGGRCRYVDCNKPEEPADELFEGAIIRFGYGLYEGRQAIIGPKGGVDGQNWTARLLSRHVDVTSPIEIGPSRTGRPILVDPVDPDAASASPAEPAKDERKREESAKTAAEWAPTATQIKGYAAELKVSEERATQLVSDFKAATAASSPDLKMVRWGRTFTTWATAKIGAPT